MFFNSDHDIRYIKDLLNISEKLAISPPISEGSEKNSNKYKYRSWAIIVLIIIANGFSLYGLKLEFPKIKPTSAVLSFLANAAFFTIDIVTVVLALSNVENWEIFLNLFLYIDKKLNKSVRKELMFVENNLMHLELLIFHCLLFTMWGYSCYVNYSAYGWEHAKYVIVRYPLYYHSFITTMVIVHFASAIRLRFKKINRLLERNNVVYISLYNNKIVPQNIENIKNIEEVSQYYLLLTELVNIFNKLFGWQIFLLTENNILSILSCLNHIALNMDTTENPSNAQQSLWMAIAPAAFSIMLIVLHSLVVIYCEDVNCESRNTLSTCFHLQETVNHLSEERHQLITLIDVINLLQPRTNAAGFYFINRTLMGRIFSYICSYLIVLIQFNKEE